MLSGTPTWRSWGSQKKGEWHHFGEKPFVLTKANWRLSEENVCFNCRKLNLISWEGKTSRQMSLSARSRSKIP